MDISNIVAEKGLDIPSSLKDVFSNGSNRDHFVFYN